MSLDESFFEDEVRDGFYVPGMMKRCWAAQMEVLDEFGKFCSDLGVTWYAAYGTLLGAVRHKGFIPWDDDIDVWMKRNDYEIFLRNVNMMPESIIFMEGRFGLEDKTEFDQPFGRIINSEKYRADSDFLQRYGGFPYPAGIDIFVLDSLSSDEEEENARITATRMVWYAIQQTRKNADDAEHAIAQVEEFSGVTIDREQNIFQQLMQLFEGYCSLFEDQDSGYVSAMHDWMAYQSYRFQKSWFDETVDIPFENITVKAPVGYDKVLTAWAGDYMHPWQGANHSYPFYGKIEKKIEENAGGLPYRYYFKSEILRKPEKAERKKMVKNYLRIFLRICDMVMSSMKNADYSEISSVFGLAQETTQKFEQFLINFYPDAATEIGGMLERYYQALFSIFQLLTACDTPENENRLINLINESRDISEGIRNSVENLIIVPREVVFLLFKADGWQNLQPLYEYYKGQQDVHVYVAPIPYHHRNARFGIKMDEIYEGDQIAQQMQEMGADPADLISWRAMSLEIHTPDIVVSQNPYDQYGIGFSVEPAYYSENLQKYAGRTIYVPWFRADEVIPAHQAAYRVADSYIDMPGVIRADTVLVPSYNTRRIYIEKLTAFAGNDTWKRWEQSVQVYDPENGQYAGGRLN